MDIFEQIKFEEKCLAKYRADFLQRENSKITNKVIIQDRLLDVAEELLDTSMELSGTIGRYNRIFASCVPDNDFITVAYIGLSVVFTAVTLKESTLQKIVMTIGKQIEDNYRFALFEKENKKVIDLIKEDLNKRNSRQYEHRRKVLASKMDKYIDWEEWEPSVRSHIGGIVFSAIMDNYSDLLELKEVKKGVMSFNQVSTTDKFETWKADYVNELAKYGIEPYPMMVKPLEWGDNKRGGWYTEKLKIWSVKFHSKEHKSKLYVPQSVKAALNIQQNTPYKINQRMLEAIKDLIKSNSISELVKYNVLPLEEYPDHFNPNPKDMLKEEHDEFLQWKRKRAKTYEQKTKVNSRIMSLARTVRKATEIKDWENVHFVFNCDFVGRMYPNSTFLSPQGSDIEKSLLDFKNSVKVSKRGAVWLKVHTAKCYGVRGSEKDLVNWWEDNRNMIESIKEDWNDLRWTLAKKPFSFLRACQEDFVTSNLPVGIDGVCNGLQHYAGLYKDEITAKNLGMTTDKPADVYSLILNKVISELRKENSLMSYLWQNLNLDREFMKKPIMLLSYGITINSLTRKIFTQSWQKNKEISYSDCIYLSRIIWKLFEEELTCVIKGMEILKERVTDDFMEWESPSGFKIFQPYYKKTTMNICLRVQRRVEMSLKIQEKECNKRKQKQAFPANYIHGNDAAHAVAIINRTKKDVRAIHDEFSVHCNYVDKLQETIRDTFVEMYKRIESETLGTLNLDSINKKNFFY